MTATAAPQQRTLRRFVLTQIGALLLGVVAIPWALLLLTLSRETPDADAYVRMAFATVAGQAIAVATALGVLAASVLRRVDYRAIIADVVITVVVITIAYGSITGAARNLVQNLGALD